LLLIKSPEGSILASGDLKRGGTVLGIILGCMELPFLLDYSDQRHKVSLGVAWTSHNGGARY
jgi:hypothetical protein